MGNHVCEKCIASQVKRYTQTLKINQYTQKILPYHQSADKVDSSTHPHERKIGLAYDKVEAPFDLDLIISRIINK